MVEYGVCVRQQLQEYEKERASSLVRDQYSSFINKGDASNRRYLSGGEEHVEGTVFEREAKAKFSRLSSAQDAAIR